MKAATFVYRRPQDLDEAVALLAEFGDDAKIVAGGQTLVPMMNMRLARPTALVDINHIAGLAHVMPHHGGLSIGSLTRHAQIERYPGDLGPFEVLRSAAALIGHYGIRDCGTFGGSIAHADASAEWCLAAMLCDAVMTIAGPSGRREVAAGDFFRGHFTTALGSDEVLVETLLPSSSPYSAIEEFAPRKGDFALVAAGVRYRMDGARCRDVAIAVAGVDSVVLRLADAEATLDGAEPGDESFREVAQAAARAVEPADDLHASAQYRRSLTERLVERALDSATTSGRAADGSGRADG